MRTVRVVRIRFRAVLGDQELACGRSVPGIGRSGATVQPVDFRSFVQDLALVDGDDREVPVTLDEQPPWQTSQVAMLDFEDGSGLCANGDPAKNSDVTGWVPAGDYHAIVFSNGVPAQLNHVNPVWQAPPLGAGTMSQGPQLGYDFMKLALAVERDDDAGPAEAGGVLRLGSSECNDGAGEDGGVGALGCAKSNRNRVRLDGYVIGQSVIVAHADAVFADTDLQQGARCDRSGPACAAMLERAGVDPEQGSARETQTLYSLE